MKKLQYLFVIVFVLLNIRMYSQITWNGNTDKYWDKATNWTPNSIPTSVDDVIIPSAASVTNICDRSTGNIECNNLTIQAGAQLSVRSSKNLHVYGNLLIESPNDNSPAGSLIESGNMQIDGTVTFKRYYSVNGKWQFICSPLNNSNSDLFTTTTSGNFNPNFLHYNEDYDCNPNPNPASVSERYAQWATTDLVYAWKNHHNGEGGAAENLVVGKGYVFFSEENTEIEFSGSTQSVLNNTDIDISVTYHGNDGNDGYYDGWNLVGNPYTSAIRWGRRNNQTTDSIENTAYCWSDDASQYKYINGNGGSESGDGSNVVNGSTEYIATGQGFFVKATCVNNGVGKFSLLKSLRRHSTQNLWKKDKNTYSQDLPQYIKFRIEDNGFSDETVIRFISDATNNFDGKYDAYKLAGSNEDVPLIFTKAIDDNILAINSLPYPITDFYHVPLCIKTKEAKQYTLMLKQSEFTDLEIFLKDNETNTLLNLKKYNSYTFDYQGGLNDERFEIIYKKNISNINSKDISNTLLYPNPSTGKFTIQTNKLANTIEVVDVSGKIIKQKNINSLTTQINLSENNKGIYFIKIIYQGNSEIKKIIIE